jgi:hypothetical protein
MLPHAGHINPRGVKDGAINFRNILTSQFEVPTHDRGGYSIKWASPSEYFQVMCDTAEELINWDINNGTSRTGILSDVIIFGIWVDLGLLSRRHAGANIREYRLLADDCRDCIMLMYFHCLNEICSTIEFITGMYCENCADIWGVFEADDGFNWAHP